MIKDSLTADIIIVGAGPAGSLAAYQLASLGYQVLILDQHSFPRYKPCGGGIPLRTLSEMPFDLTPALEFLAVGGMVSYQGTPRLRKKLDGEFAWLAMRDRMDAFLLDQARQAGANVHLGARVTQIEEQTEQVAVLTENETFFAKYLIGADGVNSITARSLNLLPNRQTGVALEAEIAVPQAAREELGVYALFDFGALPHGYGWIFPKRDHLSVGVFQAENRKNQAIKEHLMRFIDCQPGLHQHEILHLQGHRIPLGGQSEQLHTTRCLLVGDAANLADPWLGEGIFYAVRSANLAAQVLTHAMQNSSANLSEYTRLIDDEIIQDFKYSRRIGQIVYRIPRLATTLISRSPVMQRDVFINIRGDLSFQQLWKQLRKNIFTILFQTLFFRGEKNP